MNESKSFHAALLWLRVICGLTIMYYGSQKLFGAFGGMGFQATLNGFQTRLGIPPVLSSVAIFAEFFGGLGLIVGLLTRVAGFGVAATMGVAAYTKVAQTTALVMSQGKDPFREIAYPVLIGSVALALVLTGAGSFSLDQKFFGKKKK